MLFQPSVVPTDGDAACFVAFHCCITVSVGLMLFVPSALGKKGGWYKSHYLKNDVPHEQVAGSSEDNSSALEIEMGAHIIWWGICTGATLVAGGSAEILCTLQSVPMLGLIAYFLRVNERMWALASFAFVLAFLYLGVFPSPMCLAIEWRAASIFTSLLSALTLMPGVCFLFGKTEGLYKANPLMQLWCSTRERELLVGATIAGVGAAQAGAVISNVCNDFGLLAAPGFMVKGIAHWITGDKMDATSNWVVMLLCLIFGFFPRVMQ